MVERKKLTAEAKAKLKGMLPLVNNPEWDFVPDSYDEYLNDEDTKDFVPVFTIKPWDNAQCAKVRRKLEETIGELSGKNKIKNNNRKDSKEELIDFTGDNIIGWTNLIDLIKDEEIAFDKSLIKDLPDIILKDIFNELLRLSGIINKNLI